MRGEEEQSAHHVEHCTHKLKKCTYATRTTSCPALTNAENDARMFADAQLSSLTIMILIADADWHRNDASKGNALFIFIVGR